MLFRSIPGLHLRDALDLVSKQHPELIQKFGGHAMAAGLSLLATNLSAFQQAFEKVCRQLISTEDLHHIFQTDGILDSQYLNLTTAQLLNTMVWGQNFPEPSFCNEFIVVNQQPVGTGHTKALLRYDNQECEAMFFRCTTVLPEHIRAVYRLIANEWRQRWELQLHVDYWEMCTYNNL